MVGLSVGGLCFMMGYWIIMDIWIDLGDTDVWNWRITIVFFEFWLCGVSCIIYGVHCWNHILNDKKWQIWSILKQLSIVSTVYLLVIHLFQSN